MHLLRTESRSLDETAEAVDLDQTPAEIVFLSFSDSELAVLACAAAEGASDLPGLRLASLARLKHPYSVDLYVEKVVSNARFVLVRLLGGANYWPYGVGELAAAARSHGFHLAILPGDHVEDTRLDDASTLGRDELRRLWAYFQEGGVENMRGCLHFIAAKLGQACTIPNPKPVAPFGHYGPARISGAPGAPRALIVFYRSIFLAADTAPILALARAMAERGFSVTSAYVTSLKDAAVFTPLNEVLAAQKPDVILNATAFSARLDNGSNVLETADCPVLQVILAGSSREVWANSPRGLGAADLAMNVVLPELDGRIGSSVISFKAPAEHRQGLEFTRLVHSTDLSRIARLAELAQSWSTLRRTPRSARRIACVLSDYPAKDGRAGYAVGLDTPQSVHEIFSHLSAAGYDTGLPPHPAELLAALTTGELRSTLDLESYAKWLDTLPSTFVEGLHANWGPPANDPAVSSGAFHFRLVRSGKFIIALQPDRGSKASRKGDYHDTGLLPRHAYVAFYLWLRKQEQIQALIHCGTHGTLEWLPGKAVALSEDCAPEIVLGGLPLIYPFIVNNPGEAAQAKRRTAGVTVGHLTPPLIAAGSHGAAVEIEGLFDEYAEAESLDPRRAKRLAAMILERAGQAGLMEESGINPIRDPVEQLRELDAWLCDFKEMRIGDGLHVFGRAPRSESRAGSVDMLASASGADPGTVAKLLDDCAEAEMQGLLRALDGRFVRPGPAGAPARGRLDVLPTGRNLFTIDPRAVPTRTAWEIGQRTATEVVTRYAQDHGEWPKRIVLDLWGSASMRTGGDDLAQAFALLGVRPAWDHGSNRVSGFDILPLASLARPRVDVTLRISGLFRDVFPAQIALFDEAVRAIAALDEEADDNPLAAVFRSGAEGGKIAPLRIFGAAPGRYGVGVAKAIAAGSWDSRDELGETYLQASSYAYGASGDGVQAAALFRERVAATDAFVHVQDIEGQDILDSDAFSEHEGGFAAAASALGSKPALYHADTSRSGKSTVRSLSQELARVLRGRAINPRWLEGQMRHGHRGAAEIAETLDNLFAFAATTDAVLSRHFDLMFDATCGNERVRQFLMDANPQAAQAIVLRFEEAIRRGFWICRRNSSAATLADMRRAS
jgi:cobaltochelatase CobN